MFFYERHSNFNHIPITTTNDGGISPSQIGKPSGIEQLAKLGADIKSGHVQLEEHAFRRQDGEESSNPRGSALDDDDEDPTGAMDSLDIVANKRASQPNLS